MAKGRLLNYLLAIFSFYSVSRYGIIHIIPYTCMFKQNYPKPGIGMQAQINLLLYNRELEAVSSPMRIYRGDSCSIIASPTKTLEVSFAYGNCWARPLPGKYIISRLHRYKGYLQTVGLLCGPEERSELTELLLKAGATRVTDGKDMSRMVCGEAHDGEYPLLRYTRVVEY